jgi:hypothetical protein
VIVIVFRVYGMNFLMIATFPGLFSEVYHFSSGIGGLAYIGPGIGYLLAALFGAQISSKIYSAVSGYSILQMVYLLMILCIVGR